MNQIPAIIAWSPIIAYFAPVEERLCFSSVAPSSIISWFSKSGMSAVLRAEVEVLGTMLRRPFTIYTLNFLGV